MDDRMNPLLLGAIRQTRDPDQSINLDSYPELLLVELDALAEV